MVEEITDIFKRDDWLTKSKDAQIQIAIKSEKSKRARCHLHKTMAEYILVISGSLTIDVDSNKKELNQGDLIIIEPGEVHKIISKSNGLRYLIFMPKFVPDDKEYKEGC